jgi:hypothetical protein
MEKKCRRGYRSRRGNRSLRDGLGGRREIEVRMER